MTIRESYPNTNTNCNTSVVIVIQIVFSPSATSGDEASPTGSAGDAHAGLDNQQTTTDNDIYLYVLMYMLVQTAL